MQCEDIHPKLLEFVEAGLSQPDAAHVEEHLRRCAACRSEAEQLRRASAALRSSLSLIAPAGTYLTRARRRRLERARSGRRGVPRLVTLPRLVAAAAIAVILVSGWFLYHDLMSWLAPRPAPRIAQGPMREEYRRAALVLVPPGREEQVGMDEEHLLRRASFEFSTTRSRQGGLDYSRLMRMQPDGIAIPVQNAYYDSTEPAYWW